MKKLIPSLLVTFSILVSVAQAQERPPSPGIDMGNPAMVGDFTITDTENNVLNLYDHLDAGYTIFIDLFFTNCGYCQTYAPIIEEIYMNTGAGQNNVLFWGISRDPVDTDAAIDQYKIDFDITNPCAGPEGNGQAAHDVIIDGQNFLGWPTYCVICPDRTMYFDPVYPPTVSGFNPYFEQCALVGLEESDSVPQITSIQKIYPNPAGSEVSIDLYLVDEDEVTISLYNILGSEVLKESEQLYPGNNSFRINVSELPEGQYFLRMSVDRGFVEARKLVVSR